MPVVRGVEEGNEQQKEEEEEKEEEDERMEGDSREEEADRKEEGEPARRRKKKDVLFQKQQLGTYDLEMESRGITRSCGRLEAEPRHVRTRPRPHAVTTQSPHSHHTVTTQSPHSHHMRNLGQY